MEDYYSILGVAEDSSEEEIKEAYRALSKMYHPDRNPGNSYAEKMFKRLNEAYSVLGDSLRRSQYDEVKRQFEEESMEAKFADWYSQKQQENGGSGEMQFHQEATEAPKKHETAKKVAKGILWGLSGVAGIAGIAAAAQADIEREHMKTLERRNENQPQRFTSTFDKLQIQENMARHSVENKITTGAICGGLASVFGAIAKSLSDRD